MNLSTHLATAFRSLRRSAAFSCSVVLVFAYGFWQRQFGGDPGIIGRTLVLSDAPYTIVGVMPESLPAVRATRIDPAVCLKAE
jgi:hypothetical protein